MPRKKAGERGQGTYQVRINADLGEMLSDILLVRGDEVTSATLLDPMIRADLTRMHEELKPRIQKVKLLQQQLSEAIAEARQEPGAKPRKGK